MFPVSVVVLVFGIAAGVWTAVLMLPTVSELLLLAMLVEVSGSRDRTTQPVAMRTRQHAGTTCSSLARSGTTEERVHVCWTAMH